MRAILNFLTSVLAALASHVGGGFLADQATVEPSPTPVPVHAASAISDDDIADSLRGALTALPVSYLVSTKEPAAPKPQLAFIQRATAPLTDSRTVHVMLPAMAAFVDQDKLKAHVRKVVLASERAAVVSKADGGSSVELHFDAN